MASLFGNSSVPWADPITGSRNPFGKRAFGSQTGFMGDLPPGSPLAASLAAAPPVPSGPPGSMRLPRGNGGPMSGSGGMAPPMAPGEFWDPETGSKVIGSSARGMKGTGGPTWSGGAIENGQEFRYGGGQRFGMGGGAPPGRTIGGRMPGPMGGGAGAEADPFSQDTVFDPGSRKYVKRFAEGGPVFGPGTGTSDSVPAMIDGKNPARLSSGEHVDKFSTVLFHGLDHFAKLEKKADEGLAAMGLDPKTLGQASPSSPVPGFADGGLVPSIEDMRFRGFEARANLDNAQFDSAPVSPFPSGAAPIAPVPVSPSSPAPFMAPWEKDAEAAAARDAASGRPDGMRKTDWRRMQADPRFFLAQQGRIDRRVEMDAAARTRADERMVDWQRQQAMSNQAIGLDAAQRAAQQQQRTDERTVDWQRNEAARNQAIGLDAARQTQSEQARKDDLAIRRNYDMADRNMQIGADAALYGARESAKAAQGPQIKTSPKMDPKVGVQFNVMDDGTRVPARVPNPTDTDKLNYLRYFENKPDLTPDKMTPDDWVRAWHYATSGTAPESKGAAAASPPKANSRVEELGKKWGF